MRRFLFRFVGIWLLAGALIGAVVDGAKSIAASAVVLTPVRDTLALLSGNQEPLDAGAQSFAAPWPLDIALAWLMGAPAAAVLAALSVLCLIAGARRRPHQLSREFAA